MSKFFIEDNDIVRVELPEGNWVEHKRYLLQGDADYIMSKMLSSKTVVKEPEPGKPDSGKPEPITAIELSLGKLPTLERMIVRWSFPEEVTVENINRLKPELRQLVLTSIDKQKKSEFLKNS